MQDSRKQHPWPTMAHGRFQERRTDSGVRALETTHLSDEMRILTVRQPWAWAIIHGGKDIENRVRNIAGGYRGPIAIHVAQQVDLAAFSGRSAPLTAAATAFNESNTDVLKSGPWHADRGAIIGVVDLVDVHRAARHYEPIEDTPWVMECTDRPCCTPWGEREVEHLMLANPRALAEPIPYKGALGLRRLDEATIARIRGQLGES